MTIGFTIMLSDMQNHRIIFLINLNMKNISICEQLKTSLKTVNKKWIEQKLEQRQFSEV
jgi:hypothetical protein